MNDQLKFLVVEDNELDREKIERSFRSLRISNPVINVRDGIEALERMRGTAEMPPLARPYVTLLDLNMPRMDGLELLAEIRATSELRDIPVIVLTTSDRAADVEAAYQHNVAGYLVKPLERQRLTEALDRLNAFWEISLVPDHSGTAK